MRVCARPRERVPRAGGSHHASVAARNLALNLALILDLRAGARVFSTAMD